MTERWIFGDQLGPHFVDETESVLLIESTRVFARRRFHRAKAHLVLSAMRHRAAELGPRCTYLKSATYRQAIANRTDLRVSQPTSRAADDFVRSLPQVQVQPARGFASTRKEFQAWRASRGTKRLLMEDFYRGQRLRHELLLDQGKPAGGKWNLDAENRLPPPRGATKLDVAAPWWPVEDEIDRQVRADLDHWESTGQASFIGSDGPRRFAVTRTEALVALEHFIEHRLASFGPYEDAMLAADPWMAHSALSVPLNLGLLEPIEVAERVEQAYRQGQVPLASAEGFIRQIIGWRDYVWHLYWELGPEYRELNHLKAIEPLPSWFKELDYAAVQARCLSGTLKDEHTLGWVHHIPRLMILGNYAMQRGWNPQELTDWFHRSFVDGYDWVMLANVIGMSQYADGGIMATKPYAAGGAYISKMSNYCKPCAYDPKQRLGSTACPFTAGYWAFIARNVESLRGNFRMSQPLRGLERLADAAAVVLQEQQRGSRAP